ncbi:30S ribosomal protein S6--L-glutamate ligase [Plesiomonas sp.]|uniref:30S ribosomal protein S6--L-glutamate ligase n=1 Tax=Plesiomonas sp. TaxID=2486279 RepID=UPI003F37FB7D
MKIAILSRDARLYSSQRLLHAAQQRGIDAEVIDPLRCHIHLRTGIHLCTDNAALKSHSLDVYCAGKPLPVFDAVIPRIGPATAFYGSSIVRQFELAGSYTLNSSAAICCARDKLHSLQRLVASGVAVPSTCFAHSAENLSTAIQQLGRAPLVIKQIEGSQGIGVVLAESDAAAESMADAFRGLQVNVVLQEYIAESQGTDIRCFVVGDRVVAAMKRQAKAGEFRSNLHRGGSAEAVELSVAEQEIAVRATQAIGLHVAGVDILRSARGPLVMEVNASPGIEGIEHCTGIDLATLMIEYVEQQVGILQGCAARGVLHSAF